jgi:hypothetical protein
MSISDGSSSSIDGMHAGEGLGKVRANFEEESRTSEPSHNDDSILNDDHGTTTRIENQNNESTIQQNVSLAHHKSLESDSCVLFSLDLETGGPKCGIIQLSVVAFLKSGIMPCAQVRRERIFQKKNWGSHRRANKNKKEIDDDSLVFGIFLPHTPPFSLFLRRTMSRNQYRPPGMSQASSKVRIRGGYPRRLVFKNRFMSLAHLSFEFTLTECIQFRGLPTPLTRISTFLILLLLCCCCCLLLLLL